MKVKDLISMLLDHPWNYECKIVNAKTEVELNVGLIATDEKEQVTTIYVDDDEKIKGE